MLTVVSTLDSFSTARFISKNLYCPIILFVAVMTPHEFIDDFIRDLGEARRNQLYRSLHIPRSVVEAVHGSLGLGS